MNKTKFDNIFDRLTPRKKQVLLKFLAGDSDKTIAQTLCITEATVRKHIEQIGLEFGLENELIDQRRSKRSDLIAIFAKYKPELLSGSENPIVNPIVNQTANNILSRQNWAEAPDSKDFYGRTAEIDKLKQSIFAKNCRLIALLGIGGIGKTALALRTGREIAGKFEKVIWRSLLPAPTFESFLKDTINFLFENPEKPNPDLSQILTYLQNHRCLIILDGVEAILGSSQLAGNYREGYQDYGKFFKSIGELQHQSCLIITSSEKPAELAFLQGENKPVSCLELTGLTPEAAANILKNKGLSYPDKWDYLIQIYRGNPLALNLISSTILDLFDGNVSEFVKQNTIFLGKLNKVLEQAFNRLSELETEIMRRLALAQTPVSLSQLRADIAPIMSASQLIEALESLRWRDLLEKITGSDESLFTLQPVVMKYVITRYKIHQK